jgi:hypothetical protein
VATIFICVTQHFLYLGNAVIAGFIFWEIKKLLLESSSGKVSEKGNSGDIHDKFGYLNDEIMALFT